MGSCPKLAKRALMTENPVMVQIQGLIRGAGHDVISLDQVNILRRHLYLEIARGYEGSHSQRRKILANVNVISKSEKFPPPHQDGVVGVTATSFAAHDATFASFLFESKLGSSRALNHLPSGY